MIQRPADLEPEERDVHELLSAIPPQALPIGFRDDVVRRVNARTGRTWEWLLATLLAVPSLAFLAFQISTRGDEIGTAFNNIVAAATAEKAEAFFFVDGTLVLALTLLGVASVIAAHAAVVEPLRPRAAPR